MSVRIRGRDVLGRPINLREVHIDGTRCLDNGAVAIGRALALQRRPPEIPRDGIAIQAALLEPRTAKPRPRVLHLLSAVVRWC